MHAHRRRREGQRTAKISLSPFASSTGKSIANVSGYLLNLFQSKPDADESGKGASKPGYDDLGAAVARQG
jgi:hypothetical protein